MSWKILLTALATGALAYVFMPSCTAFVPDADDTLCHAIDAAEAGTGEVEWPENTPFMWSNLGDKREACEAFDHASESWWLQSEPARDYLDGYGLRQGLGWDELGRDQVMSVDPETGCVETPMARVYNGYANIAYANAEGIELDRTRPLDDFEYYDSFLKWASAYVHQRTFPVNGHCARPCDSIWGTRCVTAKTVNGRLGKNHTTLYHSFFYGIDSMRRAATIFHEVRHAHDGVLHTGGSACGRKFSCDRRWSDAGANTYEMLWLAAYSYAPSDAAYVTDFRRQRAKVLFHSFRDSNFVQRPRWTLGSFAMINDEPEWYIEEVACSESTPTHGCLSLAN